MEKNFKHLIDIVIKVTKQPTQDNEEQDMSKKETKS